MLDGNFESEQIIEEIEEQKSEQNYIEQDNINEINKQKDTIKKDIFAIQNDNISNDGWEVDWNEGWGEGDWDESDDLQNKNVNLINENNKDEQAIMEKKLVRYSISNKVKPLVDLTIKTLNEACNLNAKRYLLIFHLNSMLYT